MKTITERQNIFRNEITAQRTDSEKDNENRNELDAGEKSNRNEKSGMK